MTLGILFLSLIGFGLYFFVFKKEEIEPAQEVVFKSLAFPGTTQYWERGGEYPFRIEAAVNLWQLLNLPTNYVYSNKNSGITSPIDGEAKGISFPWSFGFTLGLGKRLFSTDWVLEANYTYFQSTGSSKERAPSGGVLIPLKGVGLIGESVREATSRYNILFNELRFYLDKPIYLLETILFSTSLGLQTSWLELKQKSIYDDYFAVLDKSSSWGIGPELGVDAKWLILNYFYLKGGLLGALQYRQGNSFYSEAEIQMKEKLHYLSPIIDFNIGIGIADYIFADKLFFALELLYDLNYYLNQDQMFSVSQSTSPRFQPIGKDLAFQGFSLKATLSF